MYNFCMRPFNFDAEVARIRHDFPEETKDVTFIDLCAPNAEEKVREWVCNQSGLVETFLDLLYAAGSAEVRTELLSLKDLPLYEQTAGLGTICPEAPTVLQESMEDDIRSILKSSKVCRQYKGNKKLVAVKTSYNQNFKELAAEKHPYFSLYHETGHIIVASPDFDNIEEQPPEFIRAEKRNWENGADTFALTYGIRNGVFEEQDCEAILKHRLVHGTSGDTVHFTCEAIEGIPETLQGRLPAFLIPAEITEIANLHARKFLRTAAEMTRFSEIISNLPHDGGLQRFMDSFSEAAAISPANSLERYAARKLASFAATR